MKTVLIFNDTGEGITYFVAEGNYSHLKNVYINMCFEEDNNDHVELWGTEANYDELADELANLIYNDEGSFSNKFTVVEEFPTKLVQSEDVVVIEAGFYA